MTDNKLKTIIQNNKRDEIIRIIEQSYKNERDYTYRFNKIESIFSKIIAKYKSNVIILELYIKSNHCDSQDLITNMGKGEDYKSLFDSLKKVTTKSKNEIYDLIKNKSTFIRAAPHYKYQIDIPINKIDCE